MKCQSCGENLRMVRLDSKWDNRPEPKPDAFICNGCDVPWYVWRSLERSAYELVVEVDDYEDMRRQRSGGQGLVGHFADRQRKKKS